MNVVRPRQHCSPAAADAATTSPFATFNALDDLCSTPGRPLPAYALPLRKSNTHEHTHTHTRRRPRPRQSYRNADTDRGPRGYESRACRGGPCLICRVFGDCSFGIDMHCGIQSRSSGLEENTGAFSFSGGGHRQRGQPNGTPIRSRCAKAAAAWKPISEQPRSRAQVTLWISI